MATRAAEIGPAVVGDQAETLIAAALLHDIGYAPELAVTGFHPLDGARFVRDQGHPRIASLVAHHSGARNEAALRGLTGLMDEFPFEDSRLYRALSYCDMTTGPDGVRTHVVDRVSEIVDRYGSEHVVSHAARMNLPGFLAIEAEIESLMAVSGSPEPNRSARQ